MSPDIKPVFRTLNLLFFSRLRKQSSLYKTKQPRLNLTFTHSSTDVVVGVMGMVVAVMVMVDMLMMVVVAVVEMVCAKVNGDGGGNNGYCLFI